ncbi:uncharacterized protein LOC116173955 [Photinus pyralis]|uniref:uncharacterized protein LOC116173955 n=1 Tax=Photinus pyralis TaxID=7054 RepID=UPI0012677D67|nr:uncharacterized protein LOC116173955 [Photinus pyralis]
MSWTHEQISCLNPCLYVVKDKNYHNKHVRNAALLTILNNIKPIRPVTSEADVQKKFHGLRTTYANERRKHLASIHSGMAENEVYHPSLWYYEKMDFLDDHLVVRKSNSNFLLPEEGNETSQTQEEDLLDSSINETIVEQYEVDDQGVLVPLSPEISSDLIPDHQRSGCSGLKRKGISVDTRPSTRPSSAGSGSSCHQNDLELGLGGLKKRSLSVDNRSSSATGAKGKSKKAEDPDLKVLEAVSSSLEGITDALKPGLKSSEDIFGEFVASQLKKIRNENKRLTVQYNIHTVLHEALLS